MLCTPTCRPVAHRPFEFPIRHGAAFNLGIVMRQILGAGTPRGLAASRGLRAGFLGVLRWLVKHLDRFLANLTAIRRIFGPRRHPRAITNLSPG